MLDLRLYYEDGRVAQCSLPGPVAIGRSPAADISLKSWRVARRHAAIEWRCGAWFLEDFGALSGTWLNGSRVSSHGPLQAGDEIIIGHCRILIEAITAPTLTQHAVSAAGGTASAGGDAAGDAPRPGEAAFASVPLAGTGADGQSGLETGWNLSTAFGLEANPGPNAHAASGRNRMCGADLDSDADADADADAGMLMPATAQSAAMPLGAAAASADAACRLALQAGTDLSETDRAWHAHGRRLHAALIEALELRRRDVSAMSDQALRGEADAILDQLIASDARLPQEIDRRQLCQRLVDEAVGLGPLEAMLADPAISEIMLNRHDEIYVERQGRLQRHPASFSSEQAVLGVIERIVAPLGRRIDESAPMVDARLRDGSRVNAVIAPIALRGASLTIRKFFLHRPGMQDLLRLGSLDGYMCRFLQACVRQRRNILVSGGTGSGKTTLLNVLSNCIPEHERIITIEDAAELKLNHAHLVALEARPPNLEGRGRVDIRDLVRNALRMRPDRIVVGECRGAEAFDMLAAMNTGHEGSLTTLHANSPRDALARLETMILMAGMDLPLVAVREHIAASIDLVVQQARLSDGSRRLVAISEVAGIESGRIQLQELFRYESGPPPAFVGCGVLPQRCRPLDSPSDATCADWFMQRTILETSC